MVGKSVVIKEAPTRLTDRKHKAIIDAALVEFKQNGYQLTSMDKIAQRAEVSKRTLYNHFPSKKVLFGKIVANLFDIVRQTSVVPFDSNRPLKEQLQSIAEKQVKLYTSKDFVELTRITVSEYIRLPELGNDIFSEMQSDHPTFLKWVEDAIHEGKLNFVDPIIPAKQFVAIMKSFFLWPQLFGSTVPGPEETKLIIDSTIEMFIRFYRSSEPVTG